MKKPIHKPEMVAMLVRVPVALRRELEEDAKRNKRSLSAQVAFVLEQQYEGCSKL